MLRAGAVGRVVARWRALGALPYRPDTLGWSWWRWQAFYAARGWADAYWRTGEKRPKPAWWLFPRKRPDLDCYQVVTARGWWRTAFWMYLARPTFNVLVGFGAWDVPEGDFFTNGRARWDIWRAGRPWGA